MQYVVFLRGINVGGNKKVPMAELKKACQSLGYSEVTTLLNSGNVVLSAENTTTDAVTQKLTEAIETTFGFVVPVQVKTATELQKIIAAAPFKGSVQKPHKQYVTFLPESEKEAAYYWTLDTSHQKTTDKMQELDKNYGKQITTRDWNTVLKIQAVLVY